VVGNRYEELVHVSISQIELSPAPDGFSDKMERGQSRFGANTLKTGRNDSRYEYSESRDENASEV
jgi:hypothetical protein